ncbi:MAG: type II toxin-antitoxin system HicA family toxin [Caldilineales bacterium]|nr:type II toxin-antitoxin system HicA family toxin [Caldilineales bacterium]
MAAHKPKQFSSINIFPLADDSRMCYHQAMNKRQRETLDKIFQTPVPASLEWRDIEALFLAVGARMVEGSGSRVRFELNGVVATFHRPHPEKEAKPYQVRDARRFLEQAGVKP